MTARTGGSVRLILASASPRRNELLAMLGLPFLVKPSSVDEQRSPGESPEKLAERLAEEKARSVAELSGPGTAVLGADTVVAMPDGEVFGKPVDRADAERMLKALSGKEHLVHTGFCLLAPEFSVHAVRSVTTRVRFGVLSEQDIEQYVLTGEPMDKAGAYGIQGLGGLFVRAINGSYTNVVGLPMAELYEVMRTSGLWPEFPLCASTMS